MSNGFDPTLAITLDGGEGDDELRLLGDAGTKPYCATGGQCGVAVRSTGAISGLVSYGGVEVVEDRTEVLLRVFEDATGGDRIRIWDAAQRDEATDIDAGGTSAFGSYRLAGAAPIEVRGGAGDDTFQLSGIDAAHAGLVTLDGGTGRQRRPGQGHRPDH